MASFTVVRMFITALRDVNYWHVKHTGSSLYSSVALKYEERYDGDTSQDCSFALGDVTSLDVGHGVW